ncbi:hypothetical protein DIPPA_06718 [Diplonema papillatum]|nr:hypothetical protein DIPPA_06718 [Diplonema papillatum]
MGDSEGQAPSETSEALVPPNPFVVSNDYVYSTLLLETATPTNVDPVQLSDRLSDAFSDSVVVLKRDAVCSWFANIPPEENPPPEVKVVKQLVAAGDVVPPNLLACAYHCKVASLATAEVAEREALEERRVRRIKDNEEQRRQLIEAGEAPPDEAANEKDAAPAPPLREKRNFLVFSGYPQSMQELTALQEVSWLANRPPEASDPAQPAPPSDLRPLTLNTIVALNSEHNLKQQAEAADAKAAAKPAAKKGGKPGKGKEQEVAEAVPPLLDVFVAKVAELDAKLSQSDVRDVFVETLAVDEAWFEDSDEDIVLDKLFERVQVLDDRRRQYAKWRALKSDTEIDLPKLVSLLKPQPVKEDPPAPKPAAPTPGKAPPAKAAKGGAKPKEPEKEVPEAAAPKPEPQLVAPPVTGVTPACIPCHRRYYDTLSAPLRNKTPSIAAVVTCLVEQAVRTADCRQKLLTVTVEKPVDDDDAFSTRSPCGSEKSASGTPSPTPAKAITISAHDVEEEQKKYESLNYKDALIDYIDQVLAKVDGESVVPVKRAEKTAQQQAISDELKAASTCAGQTRPPPSGKAISQRYPLGKLVEIVQEGEHCGVRGRVVGHSRGRVGVLPVCRQGEGAPAAVGVIPAHLKRVALEEADSGPEPGQPGARVRYGNTIDYYYSGRGDRVRGKTVRELERRALGLEEPNFFPTLPPPGEEHEIKVDFDADDLPPLPPALQDLEAASLVPQHVAARFLVLTAFQRLFSHHFPDCSDSLSFADYLYQETLDQPTLLQEFREVAAVQGWDALTSWYDAAERQALVLFFNAFCEDRCEWAADETLLTGKVFFGKWLEWVTEVGERDARELERYRSNMKTEAERELPDVPAQEPTSLNDSENPKPAALDPAEASNSTNANNNSGAAGGDGGNPERVEDPPAEGGEQEQQQQQQPAAAVVDSLGAAVDVSLEQRQSARLKRLKALLDDGGRQHLLARSCEAVSHETARLFPADGATVTVTQLAGNTRSVSISLQQDGVCSSLKVPATPPAPSDPDSADPPGEPWHTLSPALPGQDATFPPGESAASVRNPVRHTTTFPDSTVLTVSSRVVFPRPLPPSRGGAGGKPGTPDDAKNEPTDADALDPAAGSVNQNPVVAEEAAAEARRRRAAAEKSRAAAPRFGADPFALEKFVEVKAEYAAGDGVHVSLLASGEVAMARGPPVLRVKEQPVPPARNASEGPVAVRKAAVEDLSAAHSLAFAPSADGGAGNAPASSSPRSVAAPMCVLQVYKEESHAIVPVCTREVHRKIVGASVVRTMEDGTVSVAMPDGTVAQKHYGSWLVVKPSGARHVLAPDAAAARAAPDLLVSSHRDAASRALITTREDLVMTVVNDLTDGSVFVTHADGTTIWTQRQVVVGPQHDMPALPVFGTYKQVGCKNGHPVYASTADPTMTLAAFRAPEPGGAEVFWKFSDGTRSKPVAAGSCAGDVAEWLYSGNLRYLRVTVVKQCRIECAGFPSVETCAQPTQVQVFTKDLTTLSWVASTGMISCRRNDGTLVTIDSARQIVCHQQASLSSGDDDGTGGVGVQKPAEPDSPVAADTAEGTMVVAEKKPRVSAVADWMDGDEGVGRYFFDLLHGTLRAVDAEQTAFEVSCAAAVRVTPLRTMEENHPATAAAQRQPVVSVPNGFFYELARAAAPSSAAFREVSVAPAAPAAERPTCSLFVVPRQHVTEGSPGATPFFSTHPCKLYLLDLKKGTAVHFMPPDAVIQYIKACSRDPGCALTTSGVGGVGGLDVIDVVTRGDLNPSLSFATELLPKVVRDSWPRGAAAAAPPREKVLALSEEVLLGGGSGDETGRIVVRQLTRAAEVTEEQALLLKHRLAVEKRDAVIREGHVQQLAYNVVPDPEIEEEEAAVKEKLMRRLHAHDADPSDPQCPSSPPAAAAEEEEPQAEPNCKPAADGATPGGPGQGSPADAAGARCYWETAEGRAVVSELVAQNEAYKKRAPPPDESAEQGAADQQPLTPQPPPPGAKANASPHGPSQAADGNDIIGETQNYLDDFKKLEPIVRAGPHKQSLDTAKTLLKSKTATRPAQAVFEALCILVGEEPSWEIAVHLFTTPTYYSRILATASNARQLTGLLPMLTPYIPLLHPSKLASSMYELAAVANWVLSCILYLQLFEALGGRGASAAAPADDSTAAGNSQRRGLAMSRTGSGAAVGELGPLTRAPAHVPSLHKNTAHADPNTGHLTKEMTVARMVRTCGNKDQSRRRFVQETYGGKKTLLDPIQSQCEQVRAVVTPASLAFGCLKEGQKYAKELQIVNVGQLGIRFTIKRLNSATHKDVNSFVSFVYSKGPVAPGMSVAVQVILTADRVMPDLDEHIEIVTESSIIKVPLTATFRPGSQGTPLKKGVKCLGSVRLPTV